MPTIESYLQNAPIPQGAKADAWEAYQAPDHDSFVNSINKLKIPQNVKADMWEMKYGGQKTAAPTPTAQAPAAPAQHGLLDDIGEGVKNAWNDIGGFSGLVHGMFTGDVQSAGNKQLVDQALQEQAAKGGPSGQLAQQTISNMKFAQTPLVHVTDRPGFQKAQKYLTTIPGMPNVSAALEGASTGAAKMAEGLTSPESIYTLGAAAAGGGPGKLTALPFGADMAAGAVSSGAEAVKAGFQGDVRGAAEHGITSLLSGAMAGHMMGDSDLRSEAPSTPEPGPTAQVDHPLPDQRSLFSIAPQQGRLFSESIHSVPSVPESESLTTTPSKQLDFDFHPGQRDLFAQHGADYTPPEVVPSAPKESVAPSQMQLFPWQQSLFKPEVEDSTTPAKDNSAQLPLLPQQGRLFSVKGEALPPQEGVAGPMSPEAEAVSKAAQDKAQGVSPQAPQEPVAKPTEGPMAQPVDEDRVKGLEDSIRTQTGQLVGLNKLLQGNPVHAALERAINETQSVRDPQALAVGAGIDPEDRKILSIALGEKVGSTLTPEQVDRAYELRGKVKDGNPPVLQLRPHASKATLADARDAMQKALADPNTDEATKQKLTDALQPDENGEPKKFLYEPLRKSADAVSLPDEHPMAPFTPKTFAAEHPEISMKNLETALGSKPRSIDMGLGDPELKRQLKGAVAKATTEGEGTVNQNTDGFTYEARNNPKGITGDLQRTKQEFLEGAVRAKINQIGSKLREDVGAYQNLRDASKPSELIDQLKRVDPVALPKEVRDLVKPPKTDTPKTVAASEAGKRVEAASASNRSSSTEAPTMKQSGRLVEKYTDAIAKQYPHKLDKVYKLIEKAADHFKDDTEGSVHAMAEAIKIYKKGLDSGDDFAFKSAVRSIRQRTPYGDTGVELNSGLNPKPLIRGIKEVKNLVRPTFTDDDIAMSTQDAMDRRLSRYEQMTPANRSAYSKQIWDDANDRMAQEGDPNGSQGFQQRLADLRKTVPRSSVSATFKHWLSGDETENEKKARLAQADIRAKNGTRARADQIVKTKLEAAWKVTKGWSSFESRDFMHKMELNLDHGDEFKNNLAGMLREALDGARDAITRANGDFEYYLEHYFPHIWNNVGKGRELYKQTNGLSGDESFTKNRVLDTINQGYANGLSLVTENPIELALMRVEQMNRYAMKETLAKNMKDSGVAQFFERGKPVPEGLEPLKDRAFQAAGGLAGSYHAPKEVAKMFNRFTSEGLAGKSIAGLPIYDMFRASNNVMNAAELSWSGLHGFFGATNSVLSENARGIMQVTNSALRGDLAGTKEGLKTLAGSYNVYGKYTLGRDLIAHIKDPSKFQDMQQLGDAWERAGNRVGTDAALGTDFANRAVNSWKRAADDSLAPLTRAKAGVGVIFNNIGRVMEAVASPIMEHLIPNLKAGHFAVEAGDILRNAGDRSWSDITQDLQKVSDNMDDRFGQLVYDNLFMDRAAKDILSVTMRSPGWNIGTARAGYGGIADLARSIRDAKTKNQRFQISNRTAYLGALVANTMLINGALNLMMTGQMPHGMDYFFARTGSKDENGEENRIMPKLYTYDYIGLYHHPVDTVLHKMSPMIGTAIDLYHNKSFYGREIYDPGSSVGAKMAQAAEYVGSQYLPFSLTNFNEAQTRGESMGGSLLSSVTGILPAPKWAGRTDAENLAATYHAADNSRGSGEAGSEFDNHQQYIKLRAQLRSGSMTQDQLIDQINSGKVPVGFLKHIMDPEQSTPILEKWTKSLDPDRAMHVFEKANPDERQRLTPIMLGQLSKLNDPDKIEKYADKINELQYHPDSHVFSQSKWAAANPGADHQAAASEARSKGFEVHP